MTGHNRIATALIAGFVFAALLLDLSMLPTVDRISLPDRPLIYVFASLVIGAAALSLNLRTTRAAVWTAAALTIVLLAAPTIAALRGVDVSMILIRRSWLIALTWAIAISSNLQRQRRLESEVSSLHEKLRALTDVAFDGVLVVESGVIVEASEEAAGELGYRSEEIIGLSPFAFVAPAFREMAERSSRLDQTPAPIEIALVKKSGELVFAEYFATNVRIGGRQFRVLGLRNIADRVSTERALAAVAEDERNRIGFELHDHVGQVLVGVRWAAERLVVQLKRLALDDRTVLDQAERVSELVADAIGEVRRVSSRLAPRVLDSCDIYPALQSLCIDVERGSSGLECRLSCTYKRPLDDRDTAIHLYRIAEEAVTNAVKHSRGTTIDMHFGLEDDRFVLEIADDGRGLDVDESREEGVGLRSMRHRARLLGGTLEIGRGPAGGTRLKCAFRASEGVTQTA